jgi:hypothetical protein
VFREMVLARDPETGEMAFTMLFFPHFTVLRNDIIRRAWQREHPEGQEKD